MYGWSGLIPSSVGPREQSLVPDPDRWLTPFDEDADICSHLAALGPAALAELRRVLEGSSADRTSVLRALTARPVSTDPATLIAMADTDEVVRLLRAFRDVADEQTDPTMSHPTSGG